MHEYVPEDSQARRTRRIQPPVSPGRGTRERFGGYESGQLAPVHHGALAASSLFRTPTSASYPAEPINADTLAIQGLR
jgi:hypothetical protein